MKPSRHDIPEVSLGVNSVNSELLLAAIQLYRDQLAKAIKDKNHAKMVSSGKVLIALSRRQHNLLSHQSAAVLSQPVILTPHES